MNTATAHKPIVHFVGSIPLPDAATVSRTLAAATAPHLKRLPDGEAGIRKTWIRFLQQVLVRGTDAKTFWRRPTSALLLGARISKLLWAGAERPEVTRRADEPGRRSFRN